MITARALLLMAVLGVAYAPAHSQSAGSIKGTVVDLDGRVVSEARVYLLPEDAMRQPPIETAADAEGHFSFAGLSDRAYYLDASKEQAGYIYSLFSFYIMPGQVKPKVAVKAGVINPDVLIRLGTKVAYLQINLLDGNRQQAHLELIFARPDLPGTYKRSFDGKERVPVPAVPFQLTIMDEVGNTWEYRNEAGERLLKPKPSEVLTLTARLSTHQQ